MFAYEESWSELCQVAYHQKQLCCRVRLDHRVSLEVRGPRVLKAWQDLLALQDLLESKVLRVHQEKQDLQESLVDQVIRDQWGSQGHQDPVGHQDCL